MKHRQTTINPAVISIAFILMCAVCFAADKKNQAEKLRQSLVNLRISIQGYDQFQPWRLRDVAEHTGYAVAVGPYSILTTAANLPNVISIKARIAGQNEFVPVLVKSIDYECNLCLLEIDPNSIAGPLVPVKFVEQFRRSATVDYYMLDSIGSVISGQASFYHVEVNNSQSSFAEFLELQVAGSSQRTAKGQLYVYKGNPVGIASNATEDNRAMIVPSSVINKFLANVRQEQYKGFGITGFSTEPLVNPVMRKWLKLPVDTKNGMLVSDVYTIGTGCEELKINDVILAINGNTIDSQCRYKHPLYQDIRFEHIITMCDVGSNAVFTVWRDGKKINIDVPVRTFASSDMLVPFNEYDVQPKFFITGGFVFQRMTRAMLAAQGEDWSAHCMPNLMQYYQNMSFKPSAERREIVLLSYVLPAPVNQGYQNLGQLVASKVNGKSIAGFTDFVNSLQENTGEFHIIEFENDNPTLVIDKQDLAQWDMLIAQNYGITKMMNLGK